MTDLEVLAGTLARLQVWEVWGSVAAVDSAALSVPGLGPAARRGDRVRVTPRGRAPLLAEIVAVDGAQARAMWFGSGEGVAVGDKVWLEHQRGVAPCTAWIGRVVDAFGEPMDGAPLGHGTIPVPMRRNPPPPAARRGLGARVGTGLAVLDTMLPLARGQRIGLFAGSGVGKSTLLGQLARGVAADVVVIGLIGERGREVRDFVADVLGAEGMARSVVIAASSDQSPLARRQAAWLATAVAETFRDAGQHVLLMMDSLTRFAEAHREVALAAGEPPSLRAYPPSTAHAIAGLVERAGPGAEAGQGDITAVYSILVAGSDMEEPVADIARGTLDGHVVLERAIAERGRFPAIDVRRSVSRSLPGCASDEENALLARARRLIGAYEDAEPMIRTGLYVAGTDPAIDEAMATHEALEAFVATRSTTAAAAFEALEKAVTVAATA